MTLKERIEEARDYIQSCIGDAHPEIALTLGSGIGILADGIQDATYIPYGDVPYMHTCTTVSHVGRFIVGTMSGKTVIAMQGRLHGYEGNASQDVAFPIWIMAALGAKKLITMNAAGAINESYRVGDLCMISDHINFTGRNPLANPEVTEIASRFFSMENCYDPDMRDLTRECAMQLGIPLHEGVYLGLLGSNFETAAEIRAFRIWGADTVAMSIVEEVIAARHVGMDVLGISLISNMACGVKGFEFDEDEVFKAAMKRANDLFELILRVVSRL